jgi:hypothetical protein
MIFYSWTALSDSERATPSDSERATPSDSERATPSDSERATLSDSERATLSDSERATPGDSERAPPGEGNWNTSAASDPGRAVAPVAMGITDDRGRAMRAGEETLGSGLAATVIIEAVRPAMAARTLASCYVRIGVGWLGQRTEAGGVAWNRFFLRADPDDQQATERIGP